MQLEMIVPTASMSWVYGSLTGDCCAGCKYVNCGNCEGTIAHEGADLLKGRLVAVGEATTGACLERKELSILARLLDLVVESGKICEWCRGVEANALWSMLWNSLAKIKSDKRLVYYLRRG